MRHSWRGTARAAVVLTSLLVASPRRAHAQEASLAPAPVAPAPVASAPVAPASGARGFGFVSQDGADALAIHWLVQSDYTTFLTDKPPSVTSRDTFTIGFAGLQLDAQLASIFHSSTSRKVDSRFSMPSSTRDLRRSLRSESASSRRR